MGGWLGQGCRYWWFNAWVSLLYVGKFSLPEGGLAILFFVFLHYHNGGFWYTSGV